ncbi:transposase family protein [Rubripirellula reticaptiva]|uniref:transposase family protein n=1 Tax=Rubripirellula reticaptiva TaxID=2528013 RepID=UPI001648B80D
MAPTAGTDVERFANGKIKWLRRYIKLENGAPSHDTLGRVFSRLDTGEFLTAMHHWVDQFAGSLRDKGVPSPERFFVDRSIAPLSKARCTR